MVPLTKSGVLAPIHVHCNRRKQIHLCSSEDCTSIMMSDTINLPSLDCIHLKSVGKYVVAPHYKMDTTVLKNLMDKHIISCHKMQWCVEKNEKCRQLNVPYVVHADFSSFGFKTRMYYFSVHTGVKDYFSPFERIRVSFDSETGVWSCKCPISKENCTCNHEAAAKWYVAQNFPTLMNCRTTKQR